MESKAKWLLMRQNYLRSREAVLESRINFADANRFSDLDIIDSMTFSHGTDSGTQHIQSQKSRTEYIALNLDDIIAHEQFQREYSLSMWKKELQKVRYWLSLLDAALLSLTTEERKLVDLYYCEKKSIDTIAQSPIIDTIRSRSTIKRMLNNIVSKVSEVISISDPNITDKQ